MRLQLPSENHRRSQRAFTMIEIALAIGIIGFALVAIIGILPEGMNGQKDNREDTIISQDAPYFLNAIRNGEQRVTGCVLTNYVESITIISINATAAVTNIYNTPLVAGATSTAPYDSNIIGLLSTPEFETVPPDHTNIVTAIVRAMSGTAVQQNGANSATAFRYQLTVEIAPWNASSLGYVPGSEDYVKHMEANLHEIRLKFAWPVYVLPNGTIQKIGDSRQTYRSLISSSFTNSAPGLWFFQPQSFTAGTNNL